MSFRLRFSVSRRSIVARGKRIWVGIFQAGFFADCDD